METVEATFHRSLKVWWSFAWRAMALMFAIVLPMELILFVPLFSTHLPAPGQQMDPETLRRFLVIFPIVWLLVVAAMVTAQALGMRWMIRRAHWSDFRIVLVPKSQA